MGNKYWSLFRPIPIPIPGVSKSLLPGVICINRLFYDVPSFRKKKSPARGFQHLKENDDCKSFVLHQREKAKVVDVVPSFVLKTSKINCVICLTHVR